MAQIGTFTCNDDGFFGNISTLALDGKLAILPAEKSNAKICQTTAFSTKTWRSVRRGIAPARRLSPSLRMHRRFILRATRSAQLCSNPMPRKVLRACTGAGSRSATSEADRMLLLRLSEPFASTRALVKHSDPISRQAAGVRSEGQGQRDACQWLRTLIATQFAASRSAGEALPLKRARRQTACASG